MFTVVVNNTIFSAPIHNRDILGLCFRLVQWWLIWLSHCKWQIVVSMSFSTNKSSDLSSIYHYRSGFMKTRSKLGVKLFRLKAGDSQPSGCCCARKPNGAFVKEGWGRQPNSLATSWYQSGAQGPKPQGGGWVTEKDIFVNKTGHFLCRTAWPTVSCRLRDWQPVSYTQTRLVGRLCSDRLPMIDWLKKPGYFLGKVAGPFCWKLHCFHKSRHTPLCLFLQVHKQ